MERAAGRALSFAGCGQLPQHTAICRVSLYRASRTTASYVPVCSQQAKALDAQTTGS